MKMTIQARLTVSFRTLALAYAEDNNEDITIHEYFRDHFVYKNFKTVNIQQDPLTGLYTLTAQPSVKDTDSFTALIEHFCREATEAGVQIIGYTPR